MDIVLVPIHSITPYELNAKQHTEAQILHLTESIKQFGFNQPLVLDENKTVLVGHGRLEAAKRLRMTAVPSLLRTGLSEAQKKAYRLIDNRIAAETSVDEVMELAELEEIGELGFDLSYFGIELPELASHRGTEEAEHGPNGFKINYTIVFDSEEQQTAFFKLLRLLKHCYPHLDTVGKRMEALSIDKQSMVDFELDE